MCDVFDMYLTLPLTQPLAPGALISCSEQRLSDNRRPGDPEQCSLLLVAWSPSLASDRAEHLTCAQIG